VEWLFGIGSLHERELEGVRCRIRPADGGGHQAVGGQLAAEDLAANVEQAASVAPRAIHLVQRDKIFQTICVSNRVAARYHRWDVTKPLQDASSGSFAACCARHAARCRMLRQATLRPLGQPGAGNHSRRSEGAALTPESKRSTLLRHGPL
jgi:hypothetical protein